MRSTNLSSDLPAPRDDEPSSLREDIFDELIDHLECSLQRERVKTADEDLARRRVIDKFGNPAAIARKLWWDAMWEKIMLQRMTTLVAGAAAVAALAVCVLLWRSLEDSREFQSAQLSKFEAALTALTEELKSRPAVAGESNWADVTVKLVREDGTPARGKVYLMPPGTANPGPVLPSQLGTERPANRASIPGEAGADGIARLGSVPFESYDLRVQLEDPAVWTHKPIFIRPGEEHIEIICPPVAKMTQLQVVLDPPADLRDVPFHFTVWVTDEYRVHAGGLQWNYDGTHETFLVFDSVGRFLGAFDHHRGQPHMGDNRFWTVDQLRPLADSSFELRAGRAGVYPSVSAQFSSASALSSQMGVSVPEDAFFQIGGSREPGGDRSHEAILTPGEINVVRIESGDEFWNEVRNLASASQLRLVGRDVVPGPDGKYRQARGGRVATSRGGGRGRGGIPVLSEMRRADTLAALNLTEVQEQRINSQLASIVNRGSGRGREPMFSDDENARLQDAQTEEQRNAIIEEIRQRVVAEQATAETNILNTLTAEQRNLFTSIRVQRSGPVILLNDSILRTELAITDAQLLTLREVYEQLAVATGGTSLDAVKAKMLEVLTPEQRAKWDELAGPALTFDAAGNVVPPSPPGNAAPAE